MLGSRQGHAWTDEEDETFLRMVAERRTPLLIALALKRSRSAVVSRIRDLRKSRSDAGASR